MGTGRRRAAAILGAVLGMALFAGLVAAVIGRRGRLGHKEVVPPKGRPTNWASATTPGELDDAAILCLHQRSRFSDLQC